MKTMPLLGLDRRTCAVVVTFAAALMSGPLPAQGTPQPGSPDSIAVVRAVERFQQALASGDSASALGLLAENALILESGDLETRGEYRSHHLAADMEFASAVSSTRHIERVTVAGNSAWIIATSHARGRFREREVDSLGAELMVLTRTPAGWRIAAIHWSSRRTPAS